MKPTMCSLVLSTLLLSTFSPHADASPLTNPIHGFNDTALFALANGEQLIVSGMFSIADSAPAKYMAKYSGSYFTEFSGGLDGPGQPMVAYGNKLVVGGTFSNAGGVPANSIATWDGVQWNALGTGFTEAGSFASITALAVVGATLYAAGDFDTAGGHPVKNVAAWNGTSWSALGPGINGTVNTIASYHGQLVVGGALGTIGAVAVGSLAVWNGSTWSKFAGAPNDTVLSLYIDNDDLYALGFNYANNLNTPVLFMWNGLAWTTVGNLPTTQNWQTVSKYGNFPVISGGDFMSDPATGAVIGWDGSSWNQLGGTFNDTVDYVTQYGDLLVAVGAFTQIGTDATIAMPHISSWDGLQWKGSLEVPAIFRNGFD